MTWFKEHKESLCYFFVGIFLLFITHFPLFEVENYCCCQLEKETISILYYVFGGTTCIMGLQPFWGTPEAWALITSIVAIGYLIMGTISFSKEKEQPKGVV